jgi:hypothetical protein
VNGIKLYQNAVSQGDKKENYYATWKFTLEPVYTSIKVGKFK